MRVGDSRHTPAIQREKARRVGRVPASSALSLLAALLFMVSPLHGQTPTLRNSVDTTVVTVGDPITMTVTVDHGPEAEVVWPDSVDLGPFEVLGARVLPASSRDGGSRSSLVLTLAAFELGDLEIPSFQVVVMEPGAEEVPLSTNRFGVRVESIGLDESGDIRELRGPLGIPIGPGRLALWALALLAVGVSAWALYRRFRRQGTSGADSPVPAKPSRPPHEIALEALARLEKSPLLERGEVKEYHIQVSDILRSYVEGRFGVQALEMTTADILSGMESTGVDRTIREGFRSFLLPCDLVKFAKLRPGPEDVRSILALGRQLVEETVPAVHEEVL